MYEPVADVNECRALYEVSGWEYANEAHGAWMPGPPGHPYELRGGAWFGAYGKRYPAYDTAFLLRMLPAHTLLKQGNGDYLATWQDHTPGGETITGHSRHQPENAMARLAINLFKAGVLLRGIGSHE